MTAPAPHIPNLLTPSPDAPALADVPPPRPMVQNGATATIAPPPATPDPTQPPPMVQNGATPPLHPSGYFIPTPQTGETEFPPEGQGYKPLQPAQLRSRPDRPHQVEHKRHNHGRHREDHEEDKGLRLL